MKCLCWMLVLTGTATVLTASVAPNREAITASQIAEAVRQEGLPVTAEQVTLLSHVTAASSNPELKVESMEPIGSRRMRVRLDCANRSECLPFFAVIERNESTASLAPVKFSALPVASSSVAATVGQPGGPVAIRSGSPAMLYIDEGHVHIRIAVVTLENGAVGQTIRIVSKDHTNTYSAEVESATTLRGRL